MLDFLKSLFDFTESSARIADEREYAKRVEHCKSVDLPPEIFLPSKDEFLAKRSVERECSSFQKNKE